MHADYHVRKQTRITITESASEGHATLELAHSAYQAELGTIPSDYASERLTLFLSLEALDAVCAAIQHFQQERANLHSPDFDADETTYTAAYDAARAQDEASPEPHSESERHTMADLLATAAVNARREEVRKTRARVSQVIEK